LRTIFELHDPNPQALEDLISRTTKQLELWDSLIASFVAYMESKKSVSFLNVSSIDLTPLTIVEYPRFLRSGNKHTKLRKTSFQNHIQELSCNCSYLQTVQVYLLVWENKFEAVCGTRMLKGMPADLNPVEQKVMAAWIQIVYRLGA
jgi:hypothetical protein